jgi:hypothetical protein
VPVNVGGTELQVCALFKKVFRLWYSRAQAYTVYMYNMYRDAGDGVIIKPPAQGGENSAPRNPKWGKIRMKHLKGLETKLYMYAGMPLKKSHPHIVHIFI